MTDKTKENLAKDISLLEEYVGKTPSNENVSIYALVSDDKKFATYRRASELPRIKLWFENLTEYEFLQAYYCLRTFHLSLTMDPEYIQLILLSEMPQENLVADITRDCDSWWKRIRDQITKARKEKSLSEELGKIVSAKVLEFVNDQSDYSFMIDLKLASPTELLNRLQLNVSFPWALSNKFLKAFNNRVNAIDFKAEDFKNVLDKNIIVHQEAMPEQVQKQILITETEDNRFKVDFQIMTAASAREAEKFRENFASILPNTELTKLQKGNLKGHFLVDADGFNLNLQVLAHILMNPLFNNRLAILESVKATSQSSGIQIFYIYSQVKKPVKLSLTLEKPQTSSTKLYVKVAVLEDLDNIQSLKHLMGQLFGFYKKEERNIRQFYDTFEAELVGDEKPPVSFQPKLESLKYQYPEIFPRNVASECQNQVEIVDDIQQGKKYRDLLPWKGKIWGCDPEGATKFVGLKTLARPTDKVKMIPCCYETQRIFTNAKEYIEEQLKNLEKPLEECTIEKKHARFLESNAQLNFCQAGTLKEFKVTSQFFGMFSNSRFARVGGDGTFLGAVLLSTLNIPGQKKSFKDLKAEVDAKVGKLREDLLHSPFLCIQENPSMVLTEEDLENPKKILRGVEELLKIKIYLFTEKEKGMIVPHHKKNYLVNEYMFEEDAIFILENPGTGRDQTAKLEPKYEIILRISSTMVSRFSKKDNVSKMAKKIYLRFIQSYYGNKEVKPSLVEKENFVSQGVNQLGKCVKLTDKKGFTYHLLEPIAPLGIKISKKETVKDMDENYFSTYKRVGQSLIEVEKFGVKAYVKVALEKIPRSYKLKFPVGQYGENDSLIFNLNKRISFLIKQYLLFALSKLWNNPTDSPSATWVEKNVKNVVTEDEEAFRSFQQTMLLKGDIPVDYQPSKLFTGSKVVVSELTDELFEKFVYFVKTQLLNDATTFVNFQTKTWMEPYIEGVEDFIPYKGQTVVEVSQYVSDKKESSEQKDEKILRMKKELSSLNESDNVTYKVERDVREANPAFLRENPESIVLAQNTPSFESAELLFKNWIQKGVNLFDRDLNVSNEDVPDLTIKTLKGKVVKEGEQNQIALGWKNAEGETVYTALLPLE